MSRRQAQPRIGGQELPLGSAIAEQLARRDRAQYLRRRTELAPLPPVAERSSTSEAAWQKAIVQVATELRFWSYHPKLSRWSARGWPDLSLLGSRAVWIECKDDHSALTPEQVNVQDRMLACGLEVYTLRPWHGLVRVATILQAPPIRLPGMRAWHDDGLAPE